MKALIFDAPNKPVVTQVQSPSIGDKEVMIRSRRVPEAVDDAKGALIEPFTCGYYAVQACKGKICAPHRRKSAWSPYFRMPHVSERR